jgi:hypothetical protein
LRGTQLPEKYKLNFDVLSEGPVSRGMALKTNVFLGKNFPDPTIKKEKNKITQPQINTQEGLGACSPGKFGVLEVQNGHFLRFQSDI